MIAPIDWSKPIERADGKPARLLAADIQGNRPYAVAVMLAGVEVVFLYDAQGECSGSRSIPAASLRNVPPAPRLFRYTRWVNVYDNGAQHLNMGGGLHESSDIAASAVGKYQRCVARVKVIVEGVEGQFDQ